MKNSHFIRFHLCISICVAVLLTGCGSNERSDFKSKWELSQPRDKDGLVYRLNKESGEVYLLVGKQAIMVEGTENSDTKKPQTAAKEAWVSYQFENLGKSTGKVEAQLKTDWRDNKMYYIFSLKGNTTNYLEQLQNASPNAQFDISLYDGGGFMVLQIPVKLSDVSQPSYRVAKFDKSFGNLAGVSMIVVPRTLEINSSAICSYDTYNRLKGWFVQAMGFTQ